MTGANGQPGEQFQWDGATITFVVPWYGPGVAGGAEFQCRHMAEHLAAHGVAVEVLTTTAGGLNTDWSTPAFAAGADLVNDVRVLRFPVRPRNARTFEELNLRILRGERLALLDEAVFVREIISSDELDATIAAERQQRIYIFTPYMFGTSYWGSRASAGQAFFIPCLHDEPYAAMTIYRNLFETAHAFMFYSAAEQRLARQLFSIRHNRMMVLGGGVDTTIRGDAARFRQKYHINEPFILYAGRRDMTKNTPVLLHYFERYHQAGGHLRLVCIGGPGEPLPEQLVRDGAAVDLGFLPQQDKYDACAAAAVLCQPSLNESFSIVIMEAWICGTPVLVHSDCAVTREFCEESGGGLHFRTYDEFVGCLEWLHEHPAVAERMGQSGAAYVLHHFTWDAVIARLLAFLRQHAPYELQRAHSPVHLSGAG